MSKPRSNEELDEMYNFRADENKKTTKVMIDTGAQVNDLSLFGIAAALTTQNLLLLEMIKRMPMPYDKDGK